MQVLLIDDEMKEFYVLFDNIKYYSDMNMHVKTLCEDCFDLGIDYFSESYIAFSGNKRFENQLAYKHAFGKRFCIRYDKFYSYEN